MSYAGIGAALRQKVVRQGFDPPICHGAADDPPLAGLHDEAGLDQRLHMMGQGGPGDACPLPKHPNREPFGTRAHEHFEHAQSLRGAEGGKGCGGFHAGRRNGG